MEFDRISMFSFQNKALFYYRISNILYILIKTPEKMKIRKSAIHLGTVNTSPSSNVSV